MEPSKHGGMTFKELLWNTIDKQPPELSSLVAFTAWEIWNARNRAYYENKSFDMLAVTKRAQKGFNDYAELWSTEKPENNKGQQDKVWKRPERGRLKCNYDVSLKMNGKIGMGFVIRDANGGVRLAAKIETRAEGSTTLLEGLAMRYALQMIKQYNISIDHVESDNMPLVEIIAGRMQPEVYVDVVVQDIRSLAMETGNPMFKYIPREANRVAHHIAQGPDQISINHIPDHVRSLVDLDVIAV